MPKVIRVLVLVLVLDLDLDLGLVSAFLFYGLRLAEKSNWLMFGRFGFGFTTLN